MNIWQPLPLVVKNSSSFSIHLFDSLSHQLYAIFPGCVRPFTFKPSDEISTLDAGCMQAPKTKDPDSSQKRYPDSREITALVAWCVGHWIQPAAWCPNSRSPQQKSCSPHASCWHPAPNTQTPTRGDVQTTDESCSPHASCWHPAPNTQTPTRGNVQMSRPQTSLVLHMLHVGIQHQTPRLQPEEMSRPQTSLVLHMLHVGTQHQTPRLQPEEMSRCPDHRRVLFSTCFMLVSSTKHPDSNQRKCPDVQTTDESCSPHASCWYPAPNTQTPARGAVQTADKSPVIEYKLQPEEMSRQQRVSHKCSTQVSVLVIVHIRFNLV